MCKEMRLKSGKHISATNCENFSRALERAYKMFIVHHNKTEASRKEFKRAAIMHEIFGEKKNIFPEVVLSRKSISIIPKKKQ